MTKKLDIEQKNIFKKFIFMMAKAHFEDTGMLDLLADTSKDSDRVLGRYANLPFKHVEDFDVVVSMEEVDSSMIPSEIKLPIPGGQLYYLHVEVLDDLKKPVDYFEIMEYVHENFADRNDHLSIYNMYCNSKTEETNG